MDARDLTIKGIKVNDFVRLKADGQDFEGKLLPSSQLEKGLLVLKLKSGYNAGLKIERIQEIEKLPEEKKAVEAKKIEAKQRPDLPSISVLHTGGTIASRIDYSTGAVFASFTPEDLLALVPELNDIANISTRKVMNIMSEDLRFHHYKEIAEAIQEEIRKGIKGIILGHGTDTMHFTSAALSFMLENLQIPVILVGSQRSTDRPSSDAAVNLVCATEFIRQTDFAGVGICMHESTSDHSCVILPACKSRKLHSSARNAFRAVNDEPIARINYESRKIEFLKNDHPKANGRELQARTGMEEKVALLKVHPNMVPEQLSIYEKLGFKGLIVEGTGLGHMPATSDENKANLEALKSLIDSGCVVVMASQCINGRVQMHVYSNLRKLLDVGVIPGEDMTAETAFIKLAWLLGNYGKEEAIELIGKNLRGEILECPKAIDLF